MTDSRSPVCAALSSCPEEVAAFAKDVETGRMIRAADGRLYAAKDHEQALLLIEWNGRPISPSADSTDLKMALARAQASVG